jgi:hypothetical protein
MYRGLRAFTAAALVASAFGIVPSFAQKSGGILRVHAIDSPPSLAYSGGSLARISLVLTPAPGERRSRTGRVGAPEPWTARHPDRQVARLKQL